MTTKGYHEPLTRTAARTLRKTRRGYVIGVLGVIVREAAIVSDTPRVIMYCRTWCGDCRRAREWLDAHEIPYVEMDVESDPEARQAAASHNEGRLHTPTFEIGEGVCVDFDPERLRELLGMR